MPVMEVHGLLTPELAARLLERNYPGQRNLNDRVVERYARDIENGRWDADAAGPIIVSDKGELLDGQHRCAAVTRCGRAIESWVRSGVPESAFTYIDAGRTRKASDFLDVPEKTCVAAMAKFLLHIRDGYAISKQTTRHTRAQVLELARADMDGLVECARLARRVYERYRWPMSGVATALYCIGLTPVGSTGRDEFVGSYLLGVAETRIQIDYQFKWLRNKAEFGGMPAYWAYKATALMWSSYTRGKPTSLVGLRKAPEGVVGFRPSMLYGHKDGEEE